MASNGDWGHAPTDKARAAHDEFIRESSSLADLPPTAPAVRFAESRGLNLGTMVRIGARALDGGHVLGYTFPDGIKYRNVETGRRWATEGATWDHAKIVYAADPDDEPTVVIVEGETDAATLVMTRPDTDVAILPAGAKHVPKNLAAQVKNYEHVYVALDNDAAGRDGVAALLEVLPNARVIKVPDPYKDLNEWYLADEEGFLPFAYSEDPPKHIFTIRELIGADLGSFEDNHFFSDGVLPMRGQCVIHGGFKSLKSFMLLDLMRALATGSTFAGQYTFLGDDPIKCLLFQFEVPPFDFQQRAISTVDALTFEQRSMFMDNVLVHQLANNEWSRLKADPALPEIVTHLAAEADAQVVIFDPVQRMTGKADLNSAAEMDLVFGAFEALQHNGFTVVYAHHNNKGGKDQSSSAYSMTGTQRFGADQDSICSMFRSKGCIPDENPQQIKQRNFAWTLRNGAARAGSITVTPRSDNPELVKVTFGPPLVSADHDEEVDF